MTLKVTDLSEEEHERLLDAYKGLVEWIDTNKVDGQETLGLLLKASVALAVMNKLPLNQVLEVVSVTYSIEKSCRPDPSEVH